VAASRPAPRRHYVWVLQVGAFAQGENADHALAVVQSLGYDAGEEKYRTKGGDQLTRVRVGPFTQQGEAETAAERIRGQDLPTLLIRQRP
jgi:cell division septation protein DedD